jgi:hypothetical protein
MENCEFRFIGIFNAEDAEISAISMSKSASFAFSAIKIGILTSETLNLRGVSPDPAQSPTGT